MAFFKQVILPAAGLAAAAAIGVTVREMIGQYTSPGVGRTHRPVNKSFNLNIDLLLDLLNFFHARFTAKHHPGQTFVLPELHGLPVKRRLLRAQVYFKSRSNTAGGIDNDRICGNDRGNSYIV
ncbi:hypothetical protein D3C77_327890 [compost metagenome]